ncbi:MAG: hypothetical protein KGY70_14485 [Bacteroidales bacterium]|nr:hypothetical protein [Bacteroidales bacterium]
MSNSDTPFGLKPIEHLNGSPWNGVTRKFRVDATAGDLGIGDPVVWNGSGNNGYPEVVLATAGAENKITGVITSVEPDPDNLDKLYIASADSGYVNVCCDPDVIFEIQGCSDSALSSDSIGLNAVIVKTHSLDTTYGISGVEMDSGASTSPSADGSYQLLIIGGVDREDNDLTAVNAKWKVLISLHSFRAIDTDNSTEEGATGV